MIKPLLLNTYDSNGGAAIATYRLHQALRNIGLESKLLIQKKSLINDSLVQVNDFLPKSLSIIRPYLDKIPLAFYKDHLKSPFSSSVVPDNIVKNINDIEHDIVHLFWITDGFARVETLKQINKPIVWTLHDMWPFTGGCHYDNECGGYIQRCGSCPILKSSRDKDLSNWNLQRKKKAWERLPITVVATSQWLADCARNSAVFKNKRIEVLPNGIDCNKFSSVEKTVARGVFNLPIDKFLVFTSAYSATEDPRKGFKYLVSAIQKLAKEGWSDRFELVVLGASASKNVFDLGIKAHFIDQLIDEVSQILLYSAADVFVAPSIQENLANTVMESLSCGLPVVAFKIGGMPDMIDHKINGYLATPLNADDLASGIAWVLENKKRHHDLSISASNYAISKYSADSIAHQYHSLYQDILKCV